MVEIVNHKSKYLLYYYGLMLIVLLSWRVPEVYPSTTLRLLFFVALLLPVFLYKKEWFVPVLATFYLVAQNNYTTSYMPMLLKFYIPVCVIAFFNRRTDSSKNTSPVFLLLFSAISLINSIVSGGDNTIWEPFLVIYLMFFCIDINDGRILSLFSYSFIVASFLLSVNYLLSLSDFSYAYTAFLDRYGWTDPNYFGFSVGFGLVIACVELLREREKSLAEYIFLISTVLVTVVVETINASRGAILASIIACVTLFLYSKNKLVYKILFAAICFIGVIFLFNNGYMDILLYRVGDGNSFDSGRFAIWNSKMSALESSDFVSFFFGVGRTGGLTIGSSNTIVGFHNDFIAMLVEFGIIPFLLTIYLFIYPIIRAKYNKILVIACCMFMFLCCFTLEPLTCGSLSYFLFFLYIIALSNSNVQYMKD